MTVRRCAAALLLGMAIEAQALAADSRFERVVLLPLADRVSVVFELTSEPAEVSTRRVSAAVFELDAGPVVMPLAAGTYVAPAGVRFVSSVAIQGAPAGEQGVLRARITLLERSRSTVRVVGRRVYVDFMPGDPPRRLAPEPAERPARLRLPVDPSPRADVPPPATVTYPAAAKPVIERFEELRPFLISASNAPSPPVLQALRATLLDISRSAGAIEVPAESQEMHGLLSSALELAMTAVDPAFAGDRKAKAQEALAFLSQAGRGL